jgi:hypothetical protein
VPRQVDSGRAFQWAFAKRLSEVLGAPISQSLAAITAREAYDFGVHDSHRLRFSKASRLSVEEILSRESHHPAIRGAASVVVASESGKQSGDVRDVLVVSRDSQLGFSSKSNSASLKHSRLSPTINFVLKWGLEAQGVSESYLNQINPVFHLLNQLKKASDGDALWANFDEKYDLVYSPLLNAFGDELLRVCSSTASSPQGACKSLFDYILGNHDFYMVCSRVNAVKIQAFNFQGSLSGESCEYPKSLLAIDNPPTNRCSRDVRFIDGSILNFRLHNASKHIEPSLKFDIRAIKLPSSIYSQGISY